MYNNSIFIFLPINKCIELWPSWIKILTPAEFNVSHKIPERALHIVRSRASSLKWEYPLLSLRSSSSLKRLLPRLPVTSIPPFIFPSITRYRRQFLHKMWPIQFAFRLRISCRIYLCSLTLSNTSSFLTCRKTDYLNEWIKSHNRIYNYSTLMYGLSVRGLLLSFKTFRGLTCVNSQTSRLR